MISGNKSKTWLTTSWILTLALVVPMLVMIINGIGASSELFFHLWETVLPNYIENTLALAGLVAIWVLLMGVPSAALVSKTNVLGGKWLRWSLMLPLAMPAYLVAYLYTDLFDYAGPVQRWLRDTFLWQSPHDYWFFDIRTLTGASIIIALVLFPYVYMLARTSFELQNPNLIKAAKSLGYNARESFFKVSLPLARPAIAVAVSLVLMETLADFATVQYFAVNTLTTAIYDTWLEYGDLAAANVLASILMFVILFVVVLEMHSRANKRHASNKLELSQQKAKLSLAQQILATLYCWGLVLAGFILPFVLLIDMVIENSSWQHVEELWQACKNSLLVATYAATIAVALAVFLSLFKRLHHSSSRAIPIQISGMGYAVPGTVLAMAILGTFGPLDGYINDLLKSLELPTVGLVMSGTVFAVIFAYVVRFSAIANGTLASGMEQIPNSLDLAPRSLGKTTARSVFSVHLPLLKSSIFVAWILVFVESMKELPAVLLLRPFNFDTLSTHIYQLISDEMLEQGALGAVLIVVFGLLPIIILNKKEDIS